MTEGSTVMLNLIPMIGDGKSPSELTKELVDRGYKIDVRQVQRDSTIKKCR